MIKVRKNSGNPSPENSEDLRSGPLDLPVIPEENKDHRLANVQDGKAPDVGLKAGWIYLSGIHRS